MALKVTPEGWVGVSQIMKEKKQNLDRSWSQRRVEFPGMQTTSSAARRGDRAGCLAKEETEKGKKQVKHSLESHSKVWGGEGMTLKSFKLGFDVAKYSSFKGHFGYNFEDVG